MRCVLKAQQATKLGGQLVAVRRGTPQHVLSAQVVVAAVYTSKAGPADRVRGCDSRKHGKAGSNVEVFASRWFSQYLVRDLKVRLRGPESGPRLGGAARCCADRLRHVNRMPSAEL